MAERLQECVVGAVPITDDQETEYETKWGQEQPSKVHL